MRFAVTGVDPDQLEKLLRQSMDIVFKLTLEELIDSYGFVLDQCEDEEGVYLEFYTIYKSDIKYTEKLIDNRDFQALRDYVLNKETGELQITVH